MTDHDALDHDCDLDDRPAVARIRWTVYGGVFKYARVCEYHRSCTEGNRGVDVLERYRPCGEDPDD
jgi:hypothetical protein